MLIKQLLGSASPLAIRFAFEGEGEGGEGGGTPAPAPTHEPSLMSDTPADDAPADDAPADDAPVEQTDEQKAEAAAAEETRRAALSEDERAEEDRRAALTDEEREAEDKAKTSAPEKYEFTFEGDAPQLDEEMLGEFEAILREDNLTQEQANRYMGFAQKLQQGWINEITQLHVDNRAAWRTASKADATIGGEKFAENLAIAKEARQAFGDEELGKLLDETGIGDHPAVIRAFYNMGVVNREHKFVNPGKPSPNAKPFYDHPTSGKQK